MQEEAAKLYIAEVFPDMVGRHRGRAERGRSGATTYNAQVVQVTVACHSARPCLPVSIPAVYRASVIGSSHRADLHLVYY